MEKVCLELVNIEIAYLDRIVLTIPRLSVHQFDRIGIVGKNGAGKSTLLKLMAGKIQPEKGKINSFVDFAYFDQLNSPETKEIEYDLIGKLSIPKTALENFSGGELTKLKIAEIFSNYREGLLLDEPTTHLDKLGKQFLLEVLEYYYGALILVSHDRTVLDKLVTKIWEVEDGTITEYTGNYSEYAAQKELQRKQQQEQHEKYVKEKSRLVHAAEEKRKKADKITQANGHISKKETKAKANKMYMTKSKDTSQKAVQQAAKAIEQRVEQLKMVEAPKNEQQLRFQQSETLTMHNKFPIMGDRITLKAGEIILLQDVSFQFPLGKNIVITGKNGSGKTTLLNYIIHQKEGVTISPKAVLGMYKQMVYQFIKNQSVMDYMIEKSDYGESKIRSVLHSMNFSGNDLKKNVCQLSGGEAIRLTLCQLFLGRYNVLFLDEPTNFLDIYCIEALERFLKAYEGTVILVSHDQAFIERVADYIYEIENKQLVLKKFE